MVIVGPMVVVVRLATYGVMVVVVVVSVVGTYGVMVVVVEEVGGT